MNKILMYGIGAVSLAAIGFAVAPSLVGAQSAVGNFSHNIYPSPITRQTAREDILIWLVNSYFSSEGNFFVISKIFIAKANAFL